MRALLDDVLREGKLETVFQPIVAIGSVDVAGYEGMVRVPADAACCRFELEQRCLRAVWRGYAGLGLPGKLFLNLSPAMLLAPTAGQRSIMDELAEAGVDARRVVVELTEAQAVADFRRLRRLARLLRRHGCGLALDDLGAGYAALRLWLELRPEFVKIDMAFVYGIERDPVKRAFVASIRDVARACGSRVIAQGSASGAELASMRALGIDFVIERGE